MELPGCAADSDCARAAASAWGVVPGLKWPVSFVGFAYFAGALVGLVVGRQAIPGTFRVLVRAGAAVSLVYLIVMVLTGYFCNYCLAAHLGNLIFWITLEAAPVGRTKVLAPIIATAATFASLVLVLVMASWLIGESQLANSVEEIIAESNEIQAEQPSSPGNSNEASPSVERPSGFTGRFRLGPREASVRVVLFTDYECPFCFKVEEQLQQVLRDYDELSVSVKHFPACEACNDQYIGKNIHPNACRAAAAAEVAGVLGGNDAFWAMHRWLFERRGKFSNNDLRGKVTALELDYEAFRRLMNDSKTLDAIQEDIEEGLLLGLQATPMIFINGVELRGLAAENAVERAILRLAAEHPPARGAEADKPATASERFLTVWKDQKTTKIPKDENAWPNGRADAPVQIVMWGDYQDIQTIEMDIAIRRLLSERNDAAYWFRHFPFNPACNPHIERTDSLLACRAAKAAEAAGKLAGAEGFWAMHAWLMDNRLRVNNSALRETAAAIGLDVDAWFQSMEDAAIQAVIEADADAGFELKLRRPPWLFVNGKQVPRFLGEGDDILRMIFDEAAKSR